jgi:acyl dehydratase
MSGAVENRTGDAKLTFEQRLRGYVGQEAEPPIEGRDPVNAAMIRAWCDAIGDNNPIYTNPEVARKSVHGGIVAPPTMIQAWFFPAVGTPRPPPQSRMAGLLELFRAAGFVAVVATNFEHEYLRYVRPGDLLVYRQVIESISGAKQTKLGTGHFVNTLGTVSDQTGAVVSLIKFRRLFFMPRDRRAEA